MDWNQHSNVKEGSHAFLGASKYHWINYDDEKLITSYKNFLAVQKGTEDHEFAKLCIQRRQKLPRSETTLNMFVNDAIGYAMTPEQLLYYSDNCFGTSDAICFRHNMLRIHDLKTGQVPAHMEQLIVYAALFCLEYRYKPSDIKTELRIYQSNQVIIFNPEADDIVPVMDKIISFDKLINDVIKREN